MTSLRGLTAACIRACRRAFTHFISLIYHVSCSHDRPAHAAVIKTAMMISHTLRTEECLFYGRGALPEIRRP